MSSRNQYLTAEQRQVAATIHATLEWMRQAAVEGRALELIESGARDRLEQAGFTVDYAVVRTPALTRPVDAHGSRVALVAARLGATRLIDNLEFDA